MRACNEACITVRSIDRSNVHVQAGSRPDDLRCCCAVAGCGATFVLANSTAGTCRHTADRIRAGGDDACFHKRGAGGTDLGLSPTSSPGISAAVVERYLRILALYGARTLHGVRTGSVCAAEVACPFASVSHHAPAVAAILRRDVFRAWKLCKLATLGWLLTCSQRALNCTRQTKVCGSTSRLHMRRCWLKADQQNLGMDSNSSARLGQQPC